MHSPPEPWDPGKALPGPGSVRVAPPVTGTHASQEPRGRVRPTPTWSGLTVPHLAAGAVFVVAGALFVAGANASQEGALRVDRTGGLRDSIAQRAEHNVRLQERADALSQQVASAQATTEPGPSRRQVQREIDTLAPAVGLTEVQGPGVGVALEDADAPDVLPDGRTGDDYIVHQEDIQAVVNALWRGGASGLTVMGQRLINTSAVRCVGNTVILQGRVYSPPFVIEAVGDVARLEASLNADPAVQAYRDWASLVGMRYTQTRSDRLVLPPYSGPLTAKYATVVS